MDKYNISVIQGSFNSSGGIAGKTKSFEIEDWRSRGGKIQISLGFLLDAEIEALKNLPWHTEDDTLNFSGGPQIKSSRKGGFQQVSADLLNLIAPIWGMSMKNLRIGKCFAQQYINEPGFSEKPYELYVTEKMKSCVIEKNLESILAALAQASHLMIMLFYCKTNPPAFGKPTKGQKPQLVYEILKDLMGEMRLIPPEDRKQFHKEFVEQRTEYNNAAKRVFENWEQDSEVYYEEEVAGYFRNIIAWLCCEHSIDCKFWWVMVQNSTAFINDLKFAE